MNIINYMITKINNKYYNLENFNHPGGSVAIKQCFGRDGTVLFRSHHPFINGEKLESILNKYECDKQELLEGEEDVPKFEFDSEFSKDLISSVQTFFKNKSTKAPEGRWVLLIFLFVFKCVSLRLYWSGNWSSLILLPLFGWLYDSNTFHDACHFALSKKQWVNNLFSHTAFQLTQPLDWIHQHNIGHHSYTNISYKDPDLYHGVSAIRLHESIEYNKKYEKQEKSLPYIWSVAVNLGLLFVSPLHMWKSGFYNYCVPLWNVSNIELVLYICEKFIYLFMYIFLPFYLFSFWKALLFTVFTRILYSLFFMINTQLTHIHDDCMIKNEDWYKHQVLTSANHSIGNPFSFLFSAGLNYQIEHHLFPSVNQFHYPMMQPIIKSVCNKHGVKYKEYSGYMDAFMSYYNYVKKLGSK